MNIRSIRSLGYRTMSQMELSSTTNNDVCCRNDITYIHTAHGHTSHDIVSRCLMFRSMWHTSSYGHNRLNLLRIFCVINYQLPTDVMHRTNVQPFLLTEKQQFCSVYCYCSFSLSHFHTHSLSIRSLFIASFTHTRARANTEHMPLPVYYYRIMCKRMLMRCFISI